MVGQDVIKCLDKWLGKKTVAGPTDRRRFLVNQVTRAYNKVPCELESSARCTP